MLFLLGTLHKFIFFFFFFFFKPNCIKKVILSGGLFFQMASKNISIKTKVPIFLDHIPLVH